MLIRLEQPQDIDAITKVNQLAFERDDEANLVTQLRNQATPYLSMVAQTDDNQIVGHIFYSPATIQTADGDVAGMGLAPMSVHPDHQQQGVGKQLIKYSLDKIAQMKIPYVIVLGHADYYPQFGFVPASLRSIHCQWMGIPEEAFMILILNPTVMQPVSGTAFYHRTFNEIM